MSFSWVRTSLQDYCLCPFFSVMPMPLLLPCDLYMWWVSTKAQQFMACGSKLQTDILQPQDSEVSLALEAFSLAQIRIMLNPLSPVEVLFFWAFVYLLCMSDWEQLSSPNNFFEKKNKFFFEVM